MRSQKSLLKSLAEIPLLLLSIVFLLSGGCSSDEKKINELFNPATYDAQLIHSPTGDSWRLKDGALPVEFAPLQSRMKGLKFSAITWKVPWKTHILSELIGSNWLTRLLQVEGTVKITRQDF